MGKKIYLQRGPNKEAFSAHVLGGNASLGFHNHRPALLSMSEVIIYPTPRWFYMVRKSPGQEIKAVPGYYCPWISSKSNPKLSQKIITYNSGLAAFLQILSNMIFDTTKYQTHDKQTITARCQQKQIRNPKVRHWNCHRQNIK